MYDKCSDCEYTNYDNFVQEVETQQKEFIEWLENEIKQNTPNVRWKHYNEDGFNDYDVENFNYIEVQPTAKVLKDVLQKYKETIVGISDEK